MSCHNACFQVGRGEKENVQSTKYATLMHHPSPLPEKQCAAMLRHVVPWYQPYPTFPAWLPACHAIKERGDALVSSKKREIKPGTKEKMLSNSNMYSRTVVRNLTVPCLDSRSCEVCTSERKIPKGGRPRFISVIEESVLEWLHIV